MGGVRKSSLHVFLSIGTLPDLLDGVIINPPVFPSFPSLPSFPSFLPSFLPLRNTGHLATSPNRSSSSYLIKHPTTPPRPHSHNTPIRSACTTTDISSLLLLPFPSSPSPSPFPFPFPFPVLFPPRWWEWKWNSTDPHPHPTSTR